jgi:hypothetical protein
MAVIFPFFHKPTLQSTQNLKIIFKDNFFFASQISLKILNSNLFSKKYLIHKPRS